MPRALWYIIGIVVVLVLVGTAGEISVRSATCMACHRQEANFAKWISGRLKADQKGFAHELLGCADCHILGAPGKTVMSRLRGLLHIATYLVPQIDPRQERVSHLFTKTQVPRENCQYCHLGAQYRKAVYLKDLTPGLKKIGLQMDHHKHVLAREDTCARCHERYKNGSAVADKNVNYAEVNHLACDSCHTVASHSYRSGLIMPIAEQRYVDARKEEPDTSAWIYATLRLPSCISEVNTIVLGQSSLVFARHGYQDVESWEQVFTKARRRPTYYDHHGVLAVFIASQSEDRKSVV